MEAVLRREIRAHAEHSECKGRALLRIDQAQPHVGERYPECTQEQAPAGRPGVQPVDDLTEQREGVVLQADVRQPQLGARFGALLPFCSAKSCRSAVSCSSSCSCCSSEGFALAFAARNAFTASATGEGCFREGAESGFPGPRH